MIDDVRGANGAYKVSNIYLLVSQCTKINMKAIRVIESILKMIKTI